MTAEPLTVSERGNRLSGLSIRRENQAYAALFLIPTAALFIGLIGYPVLYSLLLTVTGRSTVPGRLGPFVGLDNWLRITTDPIFIQAAGQTLMYVIPSAVLGVVIGLAVALVLNERFPGRSLARAALLIPWALPPVVVAAMFQWFLDSRRGLLGEWLVNAGLVDQPPLFLSGVPGTLYMLTAIHIWKTFSLIALIFLVALQYLPEETINAARIDGAGRWQRFRHVVLPFLRPTLIAAVIIQVLITIQLFDLIFALTGGGPGALLDVQPLLLHVQDDVRADRFRVRRGPRVRRHRLRRGARSAPHAGQGTGTPVVTTNAPRTGDRAANGEGRRDRGSRARSSAPRSSSSSRSLARSASRSGSGSSRPWPAWPSSGAGSTRFARTSAHGSWRRCSRSASCC